MKRSNVKMIISGFLKGKTVSAMIEGDTTVYRINGMNNLDGSLIGDKDVRADHVETVYQWLDNYDHWENIKKGENTAVSLNDTLYKIVGYKLDKKGNLIFRCALEN